VGYRQVLSYARQQHFDFFSRYAMPFYSLTFEMDATGVKAFAERRGYSFYINLCYFFTRGMQQVEAFRYRVREGQLVIYDELEVAATIPAPEGLFSFAYLGFDPDPDVYNRTAAEIVAAARERPMLTEVDDTNHVLYTALPGVRFTGLTHARTDDRTDARPRVAFGKLHYVDGRLMIPVGLEVNHVFIDGNHLSQLVELTQQEMDDAGDLEGRDSERASSTS